MDTDMLIAVAKYISIKPRESIIKGLAEIDEQQTHKSVCIHFRCVMSFPSLGRFEDCSIFRLIKISQIRDSNGMILLVEVFE